MRKYCYIDVETTGLDPFRSGIIQLSGSVEVRDKIFSFDLQAKPFDADFVNLKALEVNHMSQEQIKGFPEPEVTYATFLAMLDKFVDKYDKSDKLFFVGYNAYFDMQFMRQWFVKNHNMYFDSYFFYPALDVCILALEYLLDKRRTMENFKLVTVAKQLGIVVDESKLHDAKYDIELTKKMYNVVKRKN